MAGTLEDDIEALLQSFLKRETVRYFAKKLASSEYTVATLLGLSQGALNEIVDEEFPDAAKGAKRGFLAAILSKKQKLAQAEESEMQLPQDHPLSRFVDCLRNLSLQTSINNAEPGSVINLPEGVFWLGEKSTFSNQLFVRPCYIDLLEAKMRYFELNNKLSTVVYTGTPGIGKSHLCALVIAHELTAGRTVFFEIVAPSTLRIERKSQFFRLDLATGVCELKSFQVLNQLPSDAKAVNIIDGGPPSASYPTVEVQIFASPTKALYVGKKKCWHYLYLHTPLFGLEEMESCRLGINEFARNLTKESLEEWFSVTGGVARAALKASSAGTSLASWMAEARSIIESEQVNGIRSMIAGLQLDTFPEGSDSLFHWCVNESNVQPEISAFSPEKISLRRFKRKMLCFASGWVAKQFALKLRLENFFNIVSFILSTTGDVETAALRGYWFETLSHMILSKGGVFRCRWLDDNGEFELHLPEAELCIFQGNTDASLKAKDDLSVYCLPGAPNQVAIDSLSNPCLFFQMACGAKHDINMEGLSKLLKVMKDEGWSTDKALEFVNKSCVPSELRSTLPLFIFCTTPSNFELYYKRSQTYVRASKKAKGVKPVVQQALLEVPINFLEEQLGGRVSLKGVSFSGKEMV